MRHPPALEPRCAMPSMRLPVRARKFILESRSVTNSASKLAIAVGKKSKSPASELSQQKSLAEGEAHPLMLLPVKRGWKQHEGSGPCGASRHREGGTQGSIVASKSSALPISVAATNRTTIAHALATSPHDVAAGPSSSKGEKRSATTAAFDPPLTTTQSAQESRPKNWPVAKR